MDSIQHLDTATAAADCLGFSSVSVLHAGQGTPAQWLILELEMNIHEVSSFVITEKAPEGVFAEVRFQLQWL